MVFKKNPKEAAELHSKALAMRRREGYGLGLATSLRGLGNALSNTEDLAGAREALTECSSLFLSEKALPGFASAQLALGRVEAKSGRLAQAAAHARKAHDLLINMRTAEHKMIGPLALQPVLEAQALLRQCHQGA